MLWCYYCDERPVLCGGNGTKSRYCITWRVSLFVMVAGMSKVELSFPVAVILNIEDFNINQVNQVLAINIHKTSQNNTKSLTSNFYRDFYHSNDTSIVNRL